MDLDLYLGCVYFDRSKGGPNRGVWATEVWDGGQLRLRYWQREKEITSNQAILRAILFPLHALERATCLPQGGDQGYLHIHTIYQYLYRGIYQWSEYWLENEFRGKTSGLPIRNKELWQELLQYKPILRVTHHAKDENEIINRLLDFCWDKFDEGDKEQPEADEGKAVWYGIGQSVG